MLAVLLSIGVVYRLAVETNLTGFRCVKAGQEFGKSSLAATVAACDKNHLARIDLQVYWAESKASIFVFPVVCVRDAHKFQAMPVSVRLLQTGRIIFG